MGGNLFKLGRLPKAEYQAIESKVSNYLDIHFPGNWRIPRYYGDKADFGDLDILLSSDALAGADWTEVRDRIATDLGITTTKSTGHVFSTVYENFQVDFFLRKARFFESTYQFLCFNDIGNLIGKICRRFNLKYGEQGLAYVFRRQDEHYKKDLPISADLSAIFGFLGLDHQQWLKGFANRDEMFHWVVESPYFSVVPYQQQSKTFEKRAKERATIQAFLAWLEANQIDKVYEYEADRAAYLPQIAAHFPEANLLEAIQAEKEREAQVIAIRAKFNGRIVMELIPSLSGKALGQFIMQFKAQWPDPDQWLSKASPETIKAKILAFGTSFEA